MSNLKGMVTQVGAGFYFIQHANEKGQIECFFVNKRSIHYDILGSRRLPLGCEVSFAIGAGNQRGLHREAIHVRNEDPGLEQIDPVTYREFGTVESIDPERRWRSGVAYVSGLIRRNGYIGSDDEMIGFRGYDVVSEGADTIRVGDWLEYGITPHTNRNGDTTYSASDICTCYAPGEEIPEPVEVQRPEDVERVYTPAERHLTLRELISRKQN